MAFHLQADGQVERMIQTIVQILWAMVRLDQKDWAAKLLMAEFTINVSTNASTGYAHFELVYGFMLRITMEIPPSDYPGVVDFANKAKENLQRAHDMIIHNRIQQTIHANKRRCPDPPLEKGELAYLSTDKLNLPKGRAGKLMPLYIGPYKILEAYPETSNYVLKLPPQLERHGIYPRFHMSRLAPHEPNNSMTFPGREVNIFYNFGEDPDCKAQVHKILGHMGPRLHLV